MSKIRRLFIYTNIIIIAGLMMTGYSAIINPVEHSVLSVIGFVFPAFLVANMLFIVFWLLLDRRYVLIPVIGFILAYSPTRTYFPINLFNGKPEPSANSNVDGRPEQLSLLSYNILGYNTPQAPEGKPNPILQFIVDSDADIICLQEWTHPSGQDSLQAILDSKYAHTDSIHTNALPYGGDAVAVYSRYPIIGKEYIPITTKGNTLAVFDLLIGGDTVHVINAHLETVGMSEEEKSQFHQLVHGDRQRQDIKSDSKMIITKLAESAQVRAPQADAINDYVRRHGGQPIIFCGDINDHPLSYVHHTIAQRLTDCFREAGTGPGFTFQYNSMYVRIDNIMCSDHFEPLSCHVDKSITLSDHFPILCVLRCKKPIE